MSSSAQCGCYFFQPAHGYSSQPRYYLPQIRLQAQTQIQSTASRTKLNQTFLNHTSSTTPEVCYTFPLYDGVSVVSFKCTIGKKVIFGVVKEKNQARDQYDQAKARGEVAGLLEQSYEASDVFTTKIGNIPAGEEAIVEIEYVGELKHDAQLDGIRFTIPTAIAPRYGTLNGDLPTSAITAPGKIEIVVDVEVDDTSHIEGLSSPSHPIAMTLGRTSTQKDAFKSNRASATLSLGSAELGQDFVIAINAQDQGIPKALLELHPDIPNHRALMTTLVPKFNLPNIHPEVVFVVDRSGSMNGKMHLLVEALTVFLKSLPLSAKFNICSFGDRCSFMFPKSVPYDERSLKNALKQLEGFSANYGGTEMLQPIQETVENRLSGVPLEIMVLTDGEIWNQQQTFDFVNEAAKQDVRLFSLGIGTGASTSLVEGLARAGNGFAQFVQDNERMDKRVVRMLKAALSPHITNYCLEVVYDEVEASDDDFEMVESTTVKTGNIPTRSKDSVSKTAVISLFDPNFQEDATNQPVGRYDHLPKIGLPKTIQAPSQIPGLFSFERTSAYLLLPDSTRSIKAVMLHGTHNSTPLQLEIPVQMVGVGKTIHQLAAKKAMLDTEEGRGWLSSRTAADKTPLKTKHSADWNRIVEREAVRLGVTFQVAGKFCSFVAVESSPEEEKDLHVEEKSSTPAGFSASDLGNYDYAPPSGHWRRTTAGSVSGSGGTVLGRTAGALSTASYGNPPPAYSSMAHQSSPMRARRAAPSGAQQRNSAVKHSLLEVDLDLCQEVMEEEDEAVHYRTTNNTGSSFFSAAPPPQVQRMRQAVSFGGLLKKKRTVDKEVGERRSNSSFASVSPGNSSKRAENMPQCRMAPSSSVAHGFSTSSLMSGSAYNRPHSQLAGLGSATTPNNASAASKTHQLIGLQRFDGSWIVNNDIFQLIGLLKADFDKATFNLQGEDNTVKATLMAIAWFKKEAANDHEVWEMVVDKAIAWIARKCAVGEDVIHKAVTRAVAVFFP